MNTRHEILVLSARIGRALRPATYFDDGPISYHAALDLLAEAEDTLRAIGLSMPERSTLSGGQTNGYLPTRHPAVAKLAERIDYVYVSHTLPNTIAGRQADIHPALRPGQTEEFSE